MINPDWLKRDNNLTSTWKYYSDLLEHYLRDEQLDTALQLIQHLEYLPLPDNSSNFILYKALAYLMDGNYQKAMEVTSTAFLYGFKQFWKFKKVSSGWVNLDAIDYLLLAPLHNNPGIQSYVHSVHSDDIVPWGFDIGRTPFCSFCKATLRKSNVKCYLSKKNLQKGEEVYKFKFFNGSFDIPTESFHCDIATFDNNKNACENLKRYLLNTYDLSEYAFKIGYPHPSINYFWNTLDCFNLHDTLRIIASPIIHPSPFVTHDLNAKVENTIYPSAFEEIDKGIYYATGGEFINLLYVLTKCGLLNTS